MGKSPFKHVLIHGLVRDAQGRKMSKSLGNGIDPLEVVDKYGADALRFMLLSGIAPGSDIRYQDEKVEAARNFANKLWNASRFVIMNLQDEDGNFREMASAATAQLKPEDKWMLQTVSDAAKEITANMEKYELALAATKIYELIWNNYCDWYIELVKARLYGDDEEDKKTARYALLKVLKDLLKLLHPYMPFITEEIWSYLPAEEGAKAFLMLESWPEVLGEDYSEDVTTLETSMDAIKAIRNIRVEANAAPSKKLHALIVAADDKKDVCEKGFGYIKALANIEEISFTEKSALPEDTMSAVLPGIEIYIPSDELIDYKAEYEKLLAEKKRLESEIARASGKLANEKFVAKAPADVIQQERDKLENYKDMFEKTAARIDAVARKL